MTIIATVRNGQIQLPPGVSLPEGAEVAVEVLQTERPPETTVNGHEADRAPSEKESAPEKEEPIDGYALNRELLKFAGIVKGYPKDSSVNHDHYLYGTPKAERTHCR